MVRMSGLTTGPRGRERKEYILCSTDDHRTPEGGEEGRLDDDTHADTCLLGKGFIVTRTHEYGCQVSGFTSSLGSMRLNIVDAETVVTDADGEEAILVIHQGIHKPDEERSLLSTFQARWSGTKVENDPVQHNPASRFGLIFQNEEAEDTVIRFRLFGVSAGFKIRTPTEVDQRVLNKYEVTSKIFWDPGSKTHAQNERAAQSQMRNNSALQRIAKAQDSFHKINISTLWIQKDQPFCKDQPFWEIPKESASDNGAFPKESASDNCTFPKEHASDNCTFPKEHASDSVEFSKDPTSCKLDDDMDISDTDSGSTELTHGHIYVAALERGRGMIVPTCAHLSSTLCEPKVNATRLDQMWNISVDTAQ